MFQQITRHAVGQVHRAEIVVHVDAADVAEFDTRLVGDCTHDMFGGSPGLQAHIDTITHHGEVWKILQRLSFQRKRHAGRRRHSRCLATRREGWGWRPLTGGVGRRLRRGIGQWLTRGACRRLIRRGTGHPGWRNPRGMLLARRAFHPRRALCALEPGGLFAAFGARRTLLPGWRGMRGIRHVDHRTFKAEGAIALNHERQRGGELGDFDPAFSGHFLNQPLEPVQILRGEDIKHGFFELGHAPASDGFAGWRAHGLDGLPGGALDRP